jgi:hypothetical protein
MSQFKLVTVIEADKVISLADGSYYRYIAPDPSTGSSGLTSFYGKDRSFTTGYAFDSSDFMVKFEMTQDTAVMPIAHHRSVLSHHENCFRGPITTDNTKITALLVRTPGIDFDEDFIQHQFKLMLNDLPHGCLIYCVSNYPTDDSISITKIMKLIRS